MDDSDSDDEEERRKKKKKMLDEEEKARNEENAADYLKMSEIVWEEVQFGIFCRRNRELYK